MFNKPVKGFIPYFESTLADKVTIRSQSGSSRGGFRRQHAILEARNFVCAHIKRNDAASRRLILYLSMKTTDVLLFVRDAKTGRILVKPPEEERWVIREKSGIGRASKNDWNVIREIGPDLFDEIEKQRRWHFGFTEYYDIYIWDLLPGLPYHRLYCTIQEVSPIQDNSISFISS